jgi:hypothetical protein
LGTLHREKPLAATSIFEPILAGAPCLAPPD